MMKKWQTFLLVLTIVIFMGIPIDASDEDNRSIVLVFKHGKIAGDPAPLKKLLEKFEKENTGIKVKDEILPASTDEQHQFYAINLEGKSADFDVISMDVIWVPEFSKAGWITDVSHILPENERGKFFPGPIQSVTYQGRLYAIPWYIDAGVLYYRKDLLIKYGFSPPKTWYKLVDVAQQITPKEKGLYGFLWQGKQYEGLVCDVLEYFWGNGGDVLRDDESIINSPENVTALQFMRDIIAKYKITPPFVTTSIEESNRHIFGDGKAVFMRNWPYAWNTFERKDSPVKGKVGVSRLPAFPGKESFSTLGGWQLGINKYSRYPKEAGQLIKFLTSPEAQKTLALTIGYKPTRKALYHDPDLIKAQPFFTQLFPVFMKARPRPVTPYYLMLTQVMQPEFSAAIAGIKSPEEALISAHKQIENILRVEHEGQ